MLLFTLLRSSKTARVTIYNQYGTELAQCASMNDVFNYFYSWCEKLGFQSVIYSQTKVKNVIRVKMD